HTALRNWPGAGIDQARTLGPGSALRSRCSPKKGNPMSRRTSFLVILGCAVLPVSACNSAASKKTQDETVQYWQALNAILAQAGDQTTKARFSGQLATVHRAAAERIFAFPTVGIDKEVALHGADLGGWYNNLADLWRRADHL